MFLTKEELKTAGVPEIVAKVTNGDDSIIETVIAENIDKMKGHLNVYYDADAVFSAEGSDRNLTVLMYLKMIVIYRLYKRKANLLDDDTISDFEEAIEWLHNVAKGVVAINLPKKNTTTDTGDGFIKFGSNNKYKNRF